MELFSINNIKMMEVIDINTGSKLGYISDLEVNCEEHRIESILIPIEKSKWFGGDNYIQIAWNNIIKLGRDVILVDGIDDNIENEL